MANGTFNGVASNSQVQVRINWTSTADTASNKSRVTATLQLYKNCAYASRTYGTGSWKLSIGDSSVTKKVTVNLYADAGWVTVLSHSVDIAHASDGTKSVVISASGGISGTTLSSITCNRTVTLDAIARASTLTLQQTSVYAGSTISFSIESADNTFTHVVTFSLGSYSQSISMGTSRSGSFLVPLAWCQAMPSSTSAQATCSIETYTGTAKTGTKQYSFSLLVPESICPTLSDVTTTPSDGTALFIRNKSQCAYAFQNALGAYGSRITAYVVSGIVTSASESFTGGVLNAAGDVTFSCYVTDSRGRKSSIVTKKIHVYPYDKPTIQAWAYRCDAQGQADTDGTYLLVQADYSCSALDGSNTASCRVVYRPANTQNTSGATTLQSGVAAKLGGGIDPALSYEVIFTVTDTQGAQVVYTTHIAPSFRLINANAAHGGVAFGRMCSKSALQCALDADFEGDVAVGGLLNLSSAAIKALALCLMPVGYIYTSRSSTNPAELFGGTWVPIKDRFILAAGGTYACGAMGGEATHKLSEAELPALSGSFRSRGWNGVFSLLSSASGIVSQRDESGSTYGAASDSKSVGYRTTTISFGEDQPHNNMPPYLALYMWERTA